MDMPLLLVLLVLLFALLGGAVLFLRYSAHRDGVPQPDTLTDTRDRPPSVDRLA
jgi:hypothetical protein